MDWGMMSKGDWIMVGIAFVMIILILLVATIYQDRKDGHI